MTLFADLATEADRFRTRGVALGPTDAAEAAGWLYYEARLLDDRRLIDWLELCTDDVVYWIPANHDGGDPREEVSVVLDDRRRLEDRVHWILGGKSHAQRPLARTIRQVTNVEVWGPGDDGIADGERLTRSTQVVHELRDDAPRQLVASVEQAWVVTPDGWRMRRKRIHLLDSDRHRWNATFII